MKSEEVVVGGDGVGGEVMSFGSLLEAATVVGLNEFFDRALLDEAVGDGDFPEEGADGSKGSDSIGGFSCIS